MEQADRRTVCVYPHWFDADPDLAQNLDADPDPDPDPVGGGSRFAKNVHPPWQNPRYAPGSAPNNYFSLLSEPDKKVLFHSKNLH